MVRRRWLRAIGVAVGISLAGAGLLLAPEAVKYVLGAIGLFPRPFRIALGWGPLIVLGATLATTPDRLGRRVAGVLVEADAISTRLLGCPLARVLGIGCVLMLAAWLPQYLTWPWWLDTDQFANDALAWDEGVLPYRDLHEYSFPGPIYLMWLVGRVAGWGRMAPFYLLDAGLLIGLGVCLVRWGRGVFGKATPGLAAFAVVLNYYLSLRYDLVAQRDWHATLFALLGILTLQANPGRWSRSIAAALFAVALTFRPYVILFLPAYLSAVEEALWRQGTPPTGQLRPLLGWLAMVAGATVLAFTPLIAAGIFDDFVKSLAWTLPGGPYSQATTRNFLVQFVEGWTDPQFLSAFLGCFAAVWVGAGAIPRAARTWVLLLLGVSWYRPLAPVSHVYLLLPAALISGVGLGFVVGVILDWPRPRPVLRLLLIVVLLGWFAGSIPRFCLPRESLEAVATLWRGDWPEVPPPGCAGWMSDGTSPHYLWADYHALLDHIRATTGSRTTVANVLRKHPFPALNGPLGRRSPFPTASGLMWIRWLGPEKEDELARSLATAEDALVVWVPAESEARGHGEVSLLLPTLTETIHRNYERDTRIGEFEVWRRKLQSVAEPKGAESRAPSTPDQG